MTEMRDKLAREILYSKGKGISEYELLDTLLAILREPDEKIIDAADDNR